MNGVEIVIQTCYFKYLIDVEKFRVYNSVIILIIVGYPPNIHPLIHTFHFIFIFILVYGLFEMLFNMT